MADRQQESVSLRIVIIVIEDTRRPKQDEDDNGDDGKDVYLYIYHDLVCVFVSLYSFFSKKVSWAPCAS